MWVGGGLRGGGEPRLPFRHPTRVMLSCGLVGDPVLPQDCADVRPTGNRHLGSFGRITTTVPENQQKHVSGRQSQAECCYEQKQLLHGMAQPLIPSATRLQSFHFEWLTTTPVGQSCHAMTRSYQNTTKTRGNEPNWYALYHCLCSTQWGWPHRFMTLTPSPRTETGLQACQRA